MRVCVCGVCVFFVHMCVYMYACVYMCVCARIYKYTISDFRTQISDFHTHTRTHTHTWTHVETDRHRKTHRDTHIDTCPSPGSGFKGLCRQYHIEPYRYTHTSHTTIQIYHIHTDSHRNTHTDTTIQTHISKGSERPVLTVPHTTIQTDHIQTDTQRHTHIHTHLEGV